MQVVQLWKLPLLLLVLVQTTFSTDTCRGIHLFLQGKVALAMPALLQQATQPSFDDYVVAEFIGAGFSMTAKRLAALVPRTTLVIKQQEEAFEGAAYYFAKASQLQQASQNTSLCSPFANPTSQILRSWGDALVHLNRPQQAYAVWSNQEAQRIWSNPLCRPNYNLKVRASSKAMYEKTYIFNHKMTTTLFSHVHDPIVQHVLPLLRNNHILQNKLVWSLESAGLHSGRTWRTVVFWSNGVLSTRACVQHVDVFAGVCAMVKHLLSTVPGMNTATGQIKLSQMQPGTVVRSHAGPTNERLRMHCSVDVPVDRKTGMRIRVGDVWRSWSSVNANVSMDEDGGNACFVFREECEHEVRIDETTSRPRTVLIIDFVNPFLHNLELYKKVVAMDDREDLVAAEFHGLNTKIDRVVEKGKWEL